jgi:hypothetical protein
VLLLGCSSRLYSQADITTLHRTQRRPRALPVSSPRAPAAADSVASSPPLRAPRFLFFTSRFFFSDPDAPRPCSVPGSGGFPVHFVACPGGVGSRGAFAMSACRYEETLFTDSWGLHFLLVFCVLERTVEELHTLLCPFEIEPLLVGRSGGVGFCTLQGLCFRFFEVSCAVLRLILFWTIFYCIICNIICYVLVVVGDWYLAMCKASVFLVLRAIGGGATS